MMAYCSSSRTVSSSLTRRKKLFTGQASASSRCLRPSLASPYPSYSDTSGFVGMLDRSPDSVTTISFRKRPLSSFYLCLLVAFNVAIAGTLPLSCYVFMYPNLGQMLSLKPPSRHALPCRHSGQVPHIVLEVRFEC